MIYVNIGLNGVWIQHFPPQALAHWKTHVWERSSLQMVRASRQVGETHSSNWFPHCSSLVKHASVISAEKKSPRIECNNSQRRKALCVFVMYTQRRRSRLWLYSAVELYLIGLLNLLITLHILCISNFPPPFFLATVSCHYCSVIVSRECCNNTA